MIKNNKLELLTCHCKEIQIELKLEKGFEELVGREAMDNISKIVNDFKTIGAALITTIGPMVSIVAGALAKISGNLPKTRSIFLCCHSK